MEKFIVIVIFGVIYWIGYFFSDFVVERIKERYPISAIIVRIMFASLVVGSICLLMLCLKLMISYI